jgi:hypothetical protein
VFVGSNARRFLAPRVVQRVAAALFALVGGALVAGVF